MRGFPSRAHAAAAGAFGAAALLVPVHPLAAAVPLAWFVLACLAAPFFPGWAFFVPTTNHGPRSGQAVAITFDDGPDPRTLHPLLDLLAREKVPATFFLVGRSAAAHPGLVREIVAAGHEVGNHSQTHDPFLMLRSCSRLEAEIAGCQGVLARLGVTPLVFRPPVGITNPRLLGALRSQGLTCVAFSCRPLDFGNRRLAGLKGRVLRRVRGGDIVLLHDRLPLDAPVASWLEEVAGILAGLRQMGLRVAPLSELVGFGVMRTDPPSSGSPRSPDAQVPPGTGGPARKATDGGGSAAAWAVFLGAYPLLVAGGVALLGVRGAAATALAFWAPRGWWAASCGAVSCLLAGAVFAAGHVIRRRRFGRHGRGPVDRVLARPFGNEALPS
jgi:peptidoglycan/xylan/chitin deacetylase (PgdA/CDA1 family)